MPQCQAVPAERCSRSAQEPGLYCEEHAAEAARHIDSYDKAKREANALEVLVAGFQSAEISQTLRDFDEACTAAAVLKGYADRLDAMITVVEGYQAHFAAEDGFALMDPETAVAELEAKRDTATELLAKAELCKSVLRELESKGHSPADPQPAPSSAEIQCQAYLEAEGCTRCPVPVAEGRRFCITHDAKHSTSLTGLDKARTRSRGCLDDYESVLGSSSRGETIKLLESYIVSVRTVIEHLEEHQRQFRCKTGEQLSEEMRQLTEKRRKVMSKIDDLVLWDNIVFLAKKAAPFGSLAFFVMLLCIVLSQ